MRAQILQCLFIVCWGFGISPSLAQTSVEKTLVKSFNLNGRSTVKVELPTVVDVKKWNEPTARIEMVIAVENMSEPMLKSLITAGRYNVNSNYSPSQMILSAPAMQKTIKFNGQDIKELVRYTLYVPSATVVEQTKILNGL